MAHRQPWSFSSQLKRNNNTKKKIHVQQHNTNMINEEWNKTQNDAFYDMHAVTFVLPDEMQDVLIAGLQRFIIIPRLNHTGSHRRSDSHSKPYLHQETRAANCRRIRPSYPKL